MEAVKEDRELYQAAISLPPEKRTTKQGGKRAARTSNHRADNYAKPGQGHGCGRRMTADFVEVTGRMRL